MAKTREHDGARAPDDGVVDPLKGFRSGLRYYRRKRPFQIESVVNDQGLVLNWDVIDLATREPLGSVSASLTGPDPHTFEVDLETLIGCEADFVGTIQETTTVWAMADAIWKKALPVRSRAWLVLHSIVLTVDWLSRLIGLVLVLFAIALIARALPAVWESNFLGTLVTLIGDALRSLRSSG